MSSEGKKVAETEYKVFVGFTDGKPHVGRCQDEYGDYTGLKLFRTRTEDKQRYEDVRACKLIINRKRMQP